MKRTKKKSQSLKDLMTLPGIGKSIAQDLINIGIFSRADLKGKNPEALYEASNQFTGRRQDLCLLYVFRCAVYYANTPIEKQDPSKLKWWNWKEKGKRQKKLNALNLFIS